MADLRIPPASTAVVRQTATPVRVDAARAAQRAFFQAATGGEAPAPAQPATPAAKPEAGETPQRLPRPGSLLDIKV